MRIDELLLEMSLEEKIGQLNLMAYGETDTGTEKTQDVEGKIAAGQAGGIFGTYNLDEMERLQTLAVEQSRLGIPLLFGLDVIHGHKTVFPIPLALACSWNMDLIARTARIAAIEATADGIAWAFSPMVDISRDPRWGRVAEGAGEDAWLGSRIARVMVEALQGSDLRRVDTLMACVKHFGLYGAVEAGREYNTVDMSPVRMYEDYLPPYRAAIEAGVGSVMTAFNDINGIPATASEELFMRILREEWGFRGLTVTDYTAIAEMIDHGIGDLQTASRLALNAGVDMDMVSEGFLGTLETSLRENHVSETRINEACRRVLEAKEKLGLLDEPFRYIDRQRQKTVVLCPEHRAFARQTIPESCVLLKNDGVLPLRKSAVIALVGPLANDKLNMLGTWSIAGDSDEAVCLLQGMRTVAGPGADIRYALGSNITNNPNLVARANFKYERVVNDPRDPQVKIDEALAVCRDADIIVAAVGEAQEMSGECASRADIGLPEEQVELLRALKRTGKPLVLVVFSGRPLTLTWEDKNADAILLAWFAGTEAGHGIADVLFGEACPSGKLTMSFPRHVGQIPIYYNQKTTGRPLTPGHEFEKFKSCYIDVPNSPLYPFGFGLSYTHFEYGAVELDKTELRGENNRLVATCVIRNVGTCSGQEIVQLYLSDPVASITRPVKTLRNCAKIALAPGEERTVRFEIGIDDVKFFNQNLELNWEPGEFIVHIGPNSRDTTSARIVWSLDETGHILAHAAQPSHA